ncbi:MAG TPA: alkaline phosphatase family protein, partial [Candidatus Limnocylindrales bacterium]|nr:alkaline phosphatase family protein [Candidatus Limnocylindrales bacterium]
DKQPYAILPPAMTDGAHGAASDTNPPPFATAAVADAAETDLFPTFNSFLLTGATGLPAKSIDTRLANVNSLANGVYPITPAVPYDAYTGDSVHRFYQMWQQFDCSAAAATRENPSGCRADLLPFVETTIGTGNTKTTQPAGFNQLTTGEGSNSMGFYNMAEGDAPYLRSLADGYNSSDNFHQSVMGGTMVQHLMLGYADLLWFSDGKGNPVAPPSTQIENPNPLPGTNNFFTRDGGGANYSNCSDLTQPGVAPIVSYLQSLPKAINPNCEPGHFYGFNNISPRFNEDGTLSASATTLPASNVRHIGDELMEKGISFTFYGGHWDRAVAHQPNAYCNICNPFQYANDIMSDPAKRAAHIQDATKLHEAIRNGTLPAISYAKPDGLVDGHPASSKLDLFEGFVKKIVTELQDNRDLWKETAVFVTFDEGGGLYDSGYIQPLDYFGDGPRIPMIVVSPFSRGGRISHVYSDHVSILKFIEKNWGLKPITGRSRDNLPNPVAARSNPYVPLNSPAIGDLFDLFNFDHAELGGD